MDDSTSSRSSSTFDEEINHDWKKIASKSLKTGYREGAIDGKDSVFQDGFDRGYAQGFKIGLRLGKYKGALKIKLSHDEELDEVLSSTRKGGCRICPDNNYESIEDCIKHQNCYVDDIRKQLHSKYGKIINTQMLTKLD